MVNIYVVMQISAFSSWSVSLDDTSSCVKLGNVEHPLLDDCCMTIRAALLFPARLIITFCHVPCVGRCRNTSKGNGSVRLHT